MNKKEVVYMVSYKDDANQQHLSFVKKYSDVKYLEERYGRINFEATEKFSRDINNDYFAR